MSRSSKDGIPVLHVTYPGKDIERDEAHLKLSEFAIGNFDSNREESCIFEGNLKNEFEVPVVASGCPGSSRFEVQLFSEHLETPMFMVENGTVIPLEIPSMENFNQTLAPPEDEEDKVENEISSERAENEIDTEDIDRNVPSSGMR